jgi:hypothetical protein
MTNYIISEDRLTGLLRSETMLEQLEAWGVDNWSGYEEMDWDVINGEPDLSAFQEHKRHTLDAEDHAA